MKQKTRPNLDKLFADGKEIDAAIGQGVLEALDVHRRMGHRVVEWRDGGIVEVIPPKLVVKRPKKRSR